MGRNLTNHKSLFSRRVYAFRSYCSGAFSRDLFSVHFHFVKQEKRPFNLRRHCRCAKLAFLRLHQYHRNAVHHIDHKRRKMKNRMVSERTHTSYIRTFLCVTSVQCNLWTKSLCWLVSRVSISNASTRVFIRLLCFLFRHNPTYGWLIAAAIFHRRRPDKRNVLSAVDMGRVTMMPCSSNALVRKSFSTFVVATRRDFRCRRHFHSIDICESENPNAMVTFYFGSFSFASDLALQHL